MRVRLPYRPRYPEAHALIASRRFFVIVAHRRFGKTILALNHLIRAAIDCGRRGGQFGYVGPFRNQAKAVAWKELKFYTAPIAGRRVNESELSVFLPDAAGGASIRIFGADNPDALRGLYFDGVVLDEVAQMKPHVWEEIVQPALADRAGFALFIGTPKGINLFSRLYHHAVEEQAKGSRDWGAARYPIGPDSRALPPEEVERMRRDMSENAFRQEMLCDFGASSDDRLITLDMVEAALAARPDPDLARRWPLIMGVDVARFGEDATVFLRRQGLIAWDPLILRKKSNLDVAHMLAAAIDLHKPAHVNIDQGQGTGVIDLVRDLCRDRRVAISEVPFGSRALTDRYANRRAEMWDGIRQWLMAGGGLDLSPENAQLARAELTAPMYSFDAAGRIRLEAKEEIRKRLDHSTDLGDALALTFAFPVSPDEGLAGGRPPRKRRRPEYDPFGRQSS